MTQYKMFASGAGSDGMAQIDIVADGRLVGIQWDGYAQAAVGDTGGQRWEISFSSSSAFTTNDTRSSLSTFTVLAPGVAAEPGGSARSQYIQLDQPVNAGERLFLHGASNGSAAATAVAVTAYLWVEDKTQSVRRQRL